MLLLKVCAASATINSKIIVNAFGIGGLSFRRPSVQFIALVCG